MRIALEKALIPWLDKTQTAHVRRFGRDGQLPKQPPEHVQNDIALKACLSRLLARTLLAVYLEEQQAQHAPGHTKRMPRALLRMDIIGRPQLDGWQAAFSHSGQAAFCAVRPLLPDAEPTLLALDAEITAAAPPAGRAFARGECLELPPHTAKSMTLHRNALRRWVIKEALLKALGTGLSCDPATIFSGRFGQRRGIWAGPRCELLWQIVPCPGHWLCMAWSADRQIPSPLPRLVWLGAQHLPDLLGRLRQLHPAS